MLNAALKPISQTDLQPVADEDAGEAHLGQDAQSSEGAAHVADAAPADAPVAAAPDAVAEDADAVAAGVDAVALDGGVLSAANDGAAATPAEATPEPAPAAAPAPVPVPPAAASLRAGDRLRAAREARGLTLDDVATKTRVRRDYLGALEAMNLKLLPGRAYAMAYLRSYCDLVGLDGRALAAQFQDESALTREDVRPQLRQPKSKPRSERPWLTVALVGAIGAGFVGWQLSQARRGEAPPPEAPASIIPLPDLQAGQVPPSTLGRISVRALKPGRLSVYGPGGTLFIKRDMPANAVETFDPAPGWTLHADDGAGFELLVDGQPAGLLSDTPGPVLGRRVETIRALAAPGADAPLELPPAPTVAPLPAPPAAAAPFAPPPVVASAPVAASAAPPAPVAAAPVVSLRNVAAATPAPSPAAASVAPSTATPTPTPAPSPAAPGTDAAPAG